MFRDWAVLHEDALTITRWLLKEKSTLSLSSDFDAPTFYQTLAGVTHCKPSSVLFSLAAVLFILSSVVPLLLCLSGIQRVWCNVC